MSEFVECKQIGAFEGCTDNCYYKALQNPCEYTWGGEIVPEVHCAFMMICRNAIELYEVSKDDNKRRTVQGSL